MYKPYESTDRKEYYEQFIFPRNVLTIHQWQTDISAENAVRTNRAVCFHTIPFGESKKKIRSRIGEPRFIITKLFGEKKYEILFYKEMFNNHKIISQFHFISDFLVFGGYAFKYLERSKFSVIYNLLNEKYTGIQNKVFRTITDDNNNQIRCADDVFLLLNYVSGDTGLIQLTGECANLYQSIVNGKQKADNKKLISIL